LHHDSLGRLQGIKKPSVPSTEGKKTKKYEKEEINLRSQQLGGRGTYHKQDMQCVQEHEFHIQNTSEGEVYANGLLLFLSVTSS